MKFGALNHRRVGVEPVFLEHETELRAQHTRNRDRAPLAGEDWVQGRAEWKGSKAHCWKEQKQYLGKEKEINERERGEKINTNKPWRWRGVWPRCSRICSIFSWVCRSSMPSLLTFSQDAHEGERSMSVREAAPEKMKGEGITNSQRKIHWRGKKNPNQWNHWLVLLIAFLVMTFCEEQQQRTSKGVKETWLQTKNFEQRRKEKISGAETHVVRKQYTLPMIFATNKLWLWQN